MDMESYDTLFLRTKESLQRTGSNKSFTATQFSSALRECNTCISHGLQLVKELLNSTNPQVDRLCIYLENTITLLQMLSNLIKSTIETTTMSCCTMKPFPTITGNIVLTVFLHCKDSESIYGDHLKLVETQLKVLFRTCHELQMTYLMTLEKSFLFDFAQQEEQDLLIEALNINMKIGIVVQALDVKTLAEQWKGYTVICEKYLNFLSDKNTYNEFTQSFASIIKDNMKTAMELEEDNKNILRSLKVANFTIKILSRLTNVFKTAPTNNYSYVTEFLEHIYLHNQAYLEMFAGKTHQFINLIQTNILTPIDRLCDILLQDGRFLDYICDIDVVQIESTTFLGYIILFLLLTKIIIIKKYGRISNFIKHKLINCMYRILPKGHYWFNMGLKFHSKDFGGRVKYFGLYEHFLVHAVALARTLNIEHYIWLEKRMYDSIMGTDCYTALFSSNLWVQLVRTKDDLALSSLRSLIRIYQRLEKHPPFQNSPQKIHIRYTIRKFFQVLNPESKMLMSKQLSPQNSSWYAAKVCDLPKHQLRNVEGVMLENIKTCFYECFQSPDATEEEINNLIQIMKMSSTCSFLINTASLEQYLVKLWSKACRGSECYELDEICATNPLWNFNYLEALVCLTQCIGCRFSNSANLGQVLHSMSTILDSCKEELVYLLFDIFCSLSLHRKEDENQRVIDSIFKDTLKLLLDDVEASQKSYLLNILSKYKQSKDFNEITSMVHGDELINELKLYCNMRDKCTEVCSAEWQAQLTQVGCNEFIHKCNPQKLIPSIKFEFDIGDFSTEIDEPPAKKTKLDCDDVDGIVRRLENDTLLLLSLMEDVTISDNSKKRITDVIDNLKNIVS